MFWDWKYKETTTTKTRYNNLTFRSRESDKCKNNAVWYAIYLHQRHWGRESTYFGKWKGKNLEKSSKTQSWMNWDLKEVWHRQDGRKRNKEYRWNKPSLFLDFWKVLKYSPQFQRPSFYDQRWLLSLSHCFPRKNKNKKQYWLGMLLAAYINKLACPVGARVFSMSRSVVELVPGTVWSLTEWSHWWLRFFFLSLHFACFTLALDKGWIFFWLQWPSVEIQQTCLLTHTLQERKWKPLLQSLVC